MYIHQDGYLNCGNLGQVPSEAAQTLAPVVLAAFLGQGWELCTIQKFLAPGTVQVLSPGGFRPFYEIPVSSSLLNFHPESWHAASMSKPHALEVHAQL